MPDTPQDSRAELRQGLHQQMNKRGFVASSNEELDCIIDFFQAYVAEQVRGTLNRLNKKLFFSTVSPDDQYIKDCIFEELDKLTTPPDGDKE